MLIVMNIALCVLIGKLIESEVTTFVSYRGIH